MPQIKIDEAKGELEALRRSARARAHARRTGGDPRADRGIVSAANVVTGQIVDAREVMFEIVDPSRFWVEAIAHDPRRRQPI